MTTKFCNILNEEMRRYEGKIWRFGNSIFLRNDASVVQENTEPSQIAANQKEHQAKITQQRDDKKLSINESLLLQPNSGIVSELTIRGHLH